MTWMFDLCFSVRGLPITTNWEGRITPERSQALFTDGVWTGLRAIPGLFRSERGYEESKIRAGQSYIIRGLVRLDARIQALTTSL